MNEEIIHLINTRDKFVKSEDFHNYKIWRNKVVYLIRNSKRDYYITLIDQNKTCGKQFWKYMEKLDPNESALAPFRVMEGEHKISDPAQIAETFNRYIPNTSKPLSNYDKLITFIDSNVSPDALFDIPLVQEDLKVMILKRQLELTAFHQNC